MASRGAVPYRPRAVEHTVLHGLVREHLATFLRAADAEGRGLPAFVEQEFRDFLACGVWARGFARFQCAACHAERLVPFSCKGRGFCPSCGGRRMVERAAHLVDHVLPAVPVRQWVLSLPYRLRYLLVWDHGLCRAVLAVYVRALLSFERRRARRRGIVDGRSGAITAVQRFGSAVNVNIHFHTLVLDGVFTLDENGARRFDPAPAPTDREVARLIATIRRRVLRLLDRHGIRLDGDSETADALAETSPILAACSAASIEGRSMFGRRPGAPVCRIGRDPDAPWVTSRGPRHAHVEGFDLHANRTVRAEDRAGLERLCQYLLRPPLAQGRVERLADGRVLYTLTHPWTDGTRQLLFQPLELLEKLAVLVPRPRINLLLYHGVLAAHARGRAETVRTACAPPDAAIVYPDTPPEHTAKHIEIAAPAAPARSETASASDSDPTTPAPPRRHWAWADLLRRVFAHSINCRSPWTSDGGTRWACPHHPPIPSAVWAGDWLRRAPA